MGGGVVFDPYNPQVTPLLVVISGPSGVGKDSVVQRIKDRGTQFHFVVTATSRPPRPGERHGIDYFFVSPDDFTQMIREDELLEHAIVYGQYKGIPKQQVREALASGNDVIMRLDVQGAATVKRLIPEAILIFLSAASEEELVERLRRRRTESDGQLQRRIETAREEMQCLVDFDYVVINGQCKLDSAADRVVSIIEAEHCKTRQRQVDLA